MGGRSRRSGIGVLIGVALLLSGAVLHGADEPRLVPPALADGVVINVPQRTLFVLQDGDVAARYPIAVGLRTWPTFLGPFTILAKEVDPVWDVPASIQAEQRRQGKPVLTRVLPGPTNPLGKYWIGLSVPGYGIHGTNAPNSIGKFATHGCIRLQADDIADLFARVQIGMAGVSVYETLIVAPLDGRLWLEAHRDAYGREPRDAYAYVLAQAASLVPTLPLDEALVRRMLRERDGRARRIDLGP